MSIVCTICQDLVTERPQRLAEEDELYIVAVQCGHVFHRSCILEWFQKLGSEMQNGQCPCCKTVVSLAAGLRIYPSGDKESTAITQTLSRAKAILEENSNLQGELNQVNSVLEETGCDLENERLTHEILKFEYTQNLSELENLRQQFEEKEKMNEITENNWKEIVDKLTNERHEALEQLKIMEKRHTDDKSDLEKQYMKQIEELEEKYRVAGPEHTNSPEIIKILNKSCQTDGRDAALLQARLVSYKSCLLHMDSEVRLLEEEYGKLEIQRNSGRSKRNFDCAMDLTGSDDDNEKVQNPDSDSNDFTSIECGELTCKELDEYLAKGDLIDLKGKVLDGQIDKKNDLMNIEASDNGQPNVSEEFLDAPLYTYEC